LQGLRGALELRRRGLKLRGGALELLGAAVITGLVFRCAFHQLGRGFELGRGLFEGGARVGSPVLGFSTAALFGRVRRPVLLVVVVALGLGHVGSDSVAEKRLEIVARGG